MKQQLRRMIPKVVGFGFNLGGLFAPNLMARTAMYLFSKPRKGHIRRRDQTILDTADCHSELKTEYGKIAYYSWNPTGHKTILLMHGWESNAARWSGLLKLFLKQDWEVIAMDAPAHGASSNASFDMFQYISAIHEAVERFKPETLVGHSVGGTSICFYLSEYNHPDFAQIILLGTPTHLRWILNSFGDALALSSRLRKAGDKYFSDTFNRNIDDISAPNMIKGVDLPTLIIHDEDDAVISVKDAELYNELFTNSELFITKGYGHGLQHKVVFRKIVDFISG